MKSDDTIKSQVYEKEKESDLDIKFDIITI